MFNSYSCNPNQNVSINAVTGAILKNHSKSWFERFHLKSERANVLLVEGGHRAKDRYFQNPIPEKDIIVLQMVVCGDMEVIAELVYRKDYELENTTRSEE